MYLYMYKCISYIFLYMRVGMCIRVHQRGRTTRSLYIGISVFVSMYLEGCYLCVWCWRLKSTGRAGVRRTEWCKMGVIKAGTPQGWTDGESSQSSGSLQVINSRHSYHHQPEKKESCRSQGPISRAEHTPGPEVGESRGGSWGRWSGCRPSCLLMPTRREVSWLLREDMQVQQNGCRILLPSKPPKNVVCGPP